MADELPGTDFNTAGEISTASRPAPQASPAMMTSTDGLSQDLIAPLQQLDAVARLVSKDMINELTPSIQTWARNTDQSISTVHSAVQAFKVEAGQAFMETADAMTHAGIAAAVFGENVGQAMEKAAKAALASLAAQAGVNALNALAQGLWFLAQSIFFADPAAAAAAETDFAAAAEWGAVAGVAGAAAAMIPSGNGGRGSQTSQTGRSYSGGESSPQTGGYGMAPAAVAQPSGNLTVLVMGEANAGQWLATTLNTAVQRGVPLNATTVQKSPYAAG